GRVHPRSGAAGRRPGGAGGVRRGGTAQGAQPELARPDRGTGRALRRGARPHRDRPDVDLRIVRLANFVAPRSGGLRTSLRELGAGYLAAGHEPVLIIPGEQDGDRQTAQGRVITLRGRRRPVAALLRRLQPDALEVSDRTTLRWTGRWARRHGVAAVMVSHESLVA